MVITKPQYEGYYWYKKQGQDAGVVYIEYRRDSGEFYAFSVGFEGGIRVQSMDGEWSALVNPLEKVVVSG